MKTISAGILLFILTTSFTHKFYVSNTLVEYNSRLQLFEITIKVFTDDLENAVSLGNSEKIKLEPGIIDPAINQKLCDYFLDKLHLTIDHQPALLRCLGYETEYDLTYFYLEYAYGWEFSTMKVDNTILMELFPEQKNIIDVANGAWRKTLILTKDHSSETILK